MPNSLATVTKIQMDIEDCLRSVGEVFRAFRDQDSTRISYGVLSSERRWFVNHSNHPRGLASLERVCNLNMNVRHAALPRLSNRFETVNGVALGPDGGTALSGSGDKTLRVWDLRTNRGGVERSVRFSRGTPAPFTSSP